MNDNLKIVKGILDAAVQRGLFKDAESVENAMKAYRGVAFIVGEYEKEHHPSTESGKNAVVGKNGKVAT